jgi:hypothetical protein
MTKRDGSKKKPPKKFGLAMAMEWLQDDLVRALTHGRQKLPHPDDVGDNTELSWIEMLRAFLPERYSVDKAFVVDVNGVVSEQIDVVFEVRQEMSKANIRYAAKKVASVRSLERTSGLIASAGGPLGRKELSPIIGGLLTLSTGWSPPFGTKFEASLANWTDNLNRLDLGCAAARGCFDTKSDGSVKEIWSKPEGALVWFVTRLMALLQPIATVPAVDILRWADEALKPKTTQ